MRVEETEVGLIILITTLLGQPLDQMILVTTLKQTWTFKEMLGKVSERGCEKKKHKS